MTAVPRKKLLGETLVERGIIDQKQLDKALRLQAETGGLLGRILIRLGLIDEDTLNEVLGIERVNPEVQVDPEVLQLVPEPLIRKYRVFPVRRDGNRLFVAMVDAYNILAMDDLRLLTGCEIVPLRATERDLNQLIERYLGVPEVEKALQELAEEPEEEAAPIAGETTVVDAPVIRLVNSLLAQALEENASDIHIEPAERRVVVRFRVDGMLRRVMQMPRRMHHAIVSRIKVMASMDIAERRLPQDGRIPLKMLNHEVDLRVSTVPTIFGEKVVIRLLDKEQIKGFTLEKLGFSSHNRKLFKGFLESPYGMVLVTGPTGSGKTTTLYTALKTINSVEKNIITVEDPVEYVLEGINQIQVNAKTGATFSTYLRSLLRQDPDVIMVGEIRDLETAEIAVRASTTGHLVLSTLHTNDAPGALTRLLDMGVEPFMVASSVLGVVAQRLVRRVCPACREPYFPDETELSFAGVTGSKGFFRGRGCPECNQTGYRGRIAIHEVLPITPLLQRLILKRAPLEELREAALGEGMIPLKRDGIRQALEGVTTIKEIMRVAYREAI